MDRTGFQVYLINERVVMAGADFPVHLLLRTAHGLDNLQQPMTACTSYSDQNAIRCESIYGVRIYVEGRFLVQENRLERSSGGLRFCGVVWHYARYRSIHGPTRHWPV